VQGVGAGARAGAKEQLLFFFSGAGAGAKFLSKPELEPAILGLLQLQICFILKTDTLLTEVFCSNV